MLASKSAPSRTIGLSPVLASAAPLAGGAGGRPWRQTRPPERPCSMRTRGDRRRTTSGAVDAVAWAPSCGLGQVLESQGRAGLRGLNHAPGRHAVAVPAETLLATSHLAQVPLGRPCPFRPKGPVRTKRTRLDFTPVALAKAPRLGGRGGARPSKISACHIGSRRNAGRQGLDDDMEPKPTFAVQAEVRRTNGEANTFNVARGNGQRHPLAPGHTRQGGVASGRMDHGRTGAVANGRAAEAGVRHPPAFAGTGVTGRDGRRRLHARPAKRLRRERACGALGRMGFVVKFDAVELGISHPTAQTRWNDAVYCATGSRSVAVTSAAARTRSRSVKSIPIYHHRSYVGTREGRRGPAHG